MHTHTHTHTHTQRLPHEIYLFTSELHTRDTYQPQKTSDRLPEQEVRSLFTVWDECYPVPEKAMAPHSSTLAWRLPWTEEPGRLQSMGSLRVGHDWATSLSLFALCIGEGNGNPLQCFCLENPRDGGAWWAAVCGVAQSRTRLKRLSSSSSSSYPVQSQFTREQSILL